MLTDEDLSKLKVNMLDCMADAAAAGHQLTPWEPVDGTDHRGYKATCLRCGVVAFTSSRSTFSLLAEHCPGGELQDR